MEAIGMGQGRRTCRPGMTLSCHASSVYLLICCRGLLQERTLPFSSSIFSAGECWILNRGYKGELFQDDSYYPTSFFLFSKWALEEMGSLPFPKTICRSEHGETCSRFRVLQWDAHSSLRICLSYGPGRFAVWCKSYPHKAFSPQHCAHSTVPYHTPSTH